MRMALCVLAMLICCTCTAQYRLVYDSTSLPELYGNVPIRVQQLQAGQYHEIPNRKYTLQPAYGVIKTGTFSFEHSELYKHHGKVDFVLQLNGKNIPISLQLPILKSIRFNLYTDSIKPVLNYYVNVEGVFTNGKILPLNTNMVILSSDVGKISGMQWILPKNVDFDKVVFTAAIRYSADIRISRAVYLKKMIDPRDATDYKDD